MRMPKFSPTQLFLASLSGVAGCTMLCVVLFALDHSGVVMHRTPLFIAIWFGLVVVLMILTTRSEKSLTKGLKSDRWTELEVDRLRAIVNPRWLHIGNGLLFLLMIAGIIWSLFHGSRLFAGVGIGTFASTWCSRMAGLFKPARSEQTFLRVTP